MAEMLNTIQIKSIAHQVFEECAVIQDAYEGNGIRVVKIVVGKKGNLGATLEDAKKNNAPQWVDDVRTFHLSPLTDENIFKKKLKSILPFLPENKTIDTKEISTESPKITGIMQPKFGTPKPRQEDIYKPTSFGAIAGLSGIPADLSLPIEVDEPQENMKEPNSTETKLDALNTKIDSLTDAILKLVDKPKAGRPKKIKTEEPKVEPKV